MKLVTTNNIEISRRNLEALAWALANTNDASISRYDENGNRIVLTVVEDDEHYGDRTPGNMPFDGILPPTRQQLDAFNQAIEGI